MSDAVSPLVVEQVGSRGLQVHRDEVLAVHSEVNAERIADPFYAPSRYWERLEAYATRDGFAFVTGRLDHQLVGFALGYTLPAGSAWWRGLRGSVDQELLRETGRRTFALNELMVRPAWRRRGYARALHDSLLSNRPEERATLLVRPDNAPAHAAYRSWGWYKLAELQPFDDSPVFDAMVRVLQVTAT
jgi:ribosomal protein S18 acetylase RimI-like enzyme